MDDYVDSLLQGIKYYIQKGKERLITATRNSTYNIKMNRKTVTKKQKMKRKQQYG